MLSLARIRVFIAGRSVELGQSVGVAREMSRHPVQNHADVVAVQVVDHIGKIFRRTVTAGRSKVTGHLVAPGAVKGMLRDSHQFDMGIAHLFQIVRNRMGEIAVIVETVLIVAVGMAHPAADMALIDGNRGAVLYKGLLLLHPGAVCPADFTDIRNYRRSSRTLLRLVCIGVCLIELPPVRRMDQILVHLAFLRFRKKCFPETYGIQTFHRNALLIPAVEFTDQVDSHGMGRPDSKMNSLLPVHCGRMRAKFPENVIVHTFSEEILIQFMKKFKPHSRSFLHYWRFTLNCLFCLFLVHDWTFPLFS